MKAALVRRGLPFDRTHDLNSLAVAVQGAEHAWTFSLHDLALLQPGAVLLRYPGYTATQRDAEEAIAACIRVRDSLLPFL